LTEYNVFGNQKQTLENIFYHFIKDNQYKGDNDVEFFRKNFKK